MKDRIALVATSAVVAFAFGCASSGGPGAKAKKSGGGGGGVGEAEFDSHDPKDLPYPVVSIGAGDPRWPVNAWSGELADELFGRPPKDGKPGLKAVFGHFYSVNSDVRLSLAAIPNGADGVAIHVGGQWWTISQQGGGWAFLKEGQSYPLAGNVGTLNLMFNQTLTL